jgi:glycosyltransferase involved in cell wall biosynthesis
VVVCRTSHRAYDGAVSSPESPRYEQRRSPNFSEGRGADRPRGIVVHTTDGGFEAAASWFERAESGVSSHYLVGLDGRVAQFVREEDTARHAGRILRPAAGIATGAGGDGVNPFTIGIEFEDAGDPLGVERSLAQYEAGARLLADVASRWRIPLDREHVVGHREVFAAKDCPGNLDIDRLIGRAGELLGGDDGSPSIACLLPARDAAADLPGYLDSVAALGASIVALEDGSADATPELLAGSPLVEVVLRNPRRDDYSKWDDGENRARLLAAAAELDPDWILFLDADERIDPDDARALREFLATDALAGVAYGLELYRDWEGLVATEPTHVFRLFAHHPEYELRPGRLHFNPVPVQIPARAWIRTTIRARHLDSPERLALRRRKYAEAGRDAAAPGGNAALEEPPSGPLAEWAPRPAGMPIISSARFALEIADAASPRSERSGPLLACLLPARNCAEQIPSYLECAGAFADTVIALDDGSTDATADALEASPLVSRLLRNQRRDSYAGWDDAANRQALLEAAIDAGVRWALFLDADERIDSDDAAAMRSFLESDADPATAYGFRVHRMAGVGDSYDRADLWVYRLFAPDSGQRLPEGGLHFVPIPQSTPRERWQRTTVRIQHFGGADEERRLARLRKYEEADPHGLWQRDYASPIRAAGRPRRWRRRPPGFPVLADPAGSGVALDLEELDPDAPLLSAIVIATDDEGTIERSVRAVVEQECPVEFEVIVVISGSPATGAIVRDRFGEAVTLVELAERVMPGAARNAGMRMARGEYVSFPGSHVEIAPGSLARRVRAHEDGWAMVTGSIVNGNPSRAGWASYFLDHSSALPGRPSGELAGAPAHCSYVREFVDEIGGFPEDVRAGEDTIVNQLLWRRGHRAFREAGIQLTHRSPSSTTTALLRHHFVRGRAYGRILRGNSTGLRGALGLIRYLLRYPRTRLASTDRRVDEWGRDLRGDYRRVRRLVVAGVAAAWVGALAELIFGKRRSGTRKQARDGHRRESLRTQVVEDRGKGVDRDLAGALVKEHDRSGSG